MNKHYDLAIIGAGILGTFSVLHAVKKGMQVLWIEAGDTPKGATVRNFGQVVPSGQSLAGWRQLGIRSLELYKEQIARFNLPAQQQGSLYVASDADEEGLLEEMFDIDKSMSYLSTLLPFANCQEKVPSLNQTYAKLGLFYPNEITIDSAVLIPQLVTKIAQLDGVTYRNRTSAACLESTDNTTKITFTDGTAQTAQQTLVCCGHQLNRLLPLAENDDLVISRLQMLSSEPLPLGAVKGNLLTGLSIRRYEAFHSCPSYDSIKTSSHQQALEDQGIHILVKQCQNGELIIGDSHHYYSADTSDSLDYYNEEKVNHLMLNELQRIVTLPELKIARSWNGYYSQENKQGVLAKTIDNTIHVVTGIGGKGMSTGPALMERVIDRINDHQSLNAQELLASH